MKSVFFLHYSDDSHLIKFYLGGYCFMQDYYVFIYNNILISYYFIMLIDVQVKKKTFSCFFCKRKYHQVRTSGLIYVSMGTT